MADLKPNNQKKLNHCDLQLIANRKRIMNHESDDDEDDDSNKNGDDQQSPPVNKFANDGSFLEMFKKMQQEQQESRSNMNDNKLDLINEKTKRKPKILKVGIIEKNSGCHGSSSSGSNDSSNEIINNGSAWNRYMTEVRAYKEKYGDDEDKNRPLVK